MASREQPIELANELHYIDGSDAARLLKACDELSRVLNGLINSILPVFVVPSRTCVIIATE